MSAKSAKPSKPARTEPAPPSAPPTPEVSEAPEQRLLAAALELFAHQGYSKTSTRELADRAQVNVAAIRYYYGDKAGLYRAAFSTAMGPPVPEPLGVTLGADSAPTPDTPPATLLPTLEQALHAFYGSFTEPLKEGEVASQCMKLVLREMLEPTGLWEAEVANCLAPLHLALVRSLMRHFGLSEPDDDLHRLAICLAALGVHLHVGLDVIQAVAPQLTRGADAFDQWRHHLVRTALTLVQAHRPPHSLPSPETSS